MKRKSVVRLTLVAILLMTMGLAGCSTLSAVGTAIANVAQKICDFTTAEAAQAQSAATFIGTVAPIIGTVAGVTFTSDQAIIVFNTVYSAVNTGACVSAGDLTAAVNYFNALAAAYQTATTTKTFRAVNPIPDISLLRKRVRK